MRASTILAIALLGVLVASVGAKPPVISEFEPGEIPQAASREADTLHYFFASEGPGAQGMPGTFDRGYNFEVMEPAGWFAVNPWDNAIHWHLEDVSLTAGHGTDMGDADPFYPNVPPNTYALWCGDPDLPGYGRNWTEAVQVNLPLGVSDDLEIGFAYSGSFEGQVYDYFEVHVISAAGTVVAYHNEEELEETFLNVMIELSAAELGGAVEAIQFWFFSDSAWDDEDGLIDSDIGAVWLDNLIVAVDNTVYVMEDFESGEIPPYMEFFSPIPPDVYPDIHQNVEVPYECWTNESTVWGFFDPETVEPGYPGGVIPYGPPYPVLMIQSPDLTVDQYGDPMHIQWGQEIEELAFVFDLYEDLPMEALLAWSYHVSARDADTGEWGPWKSPDTVIFPPEFHCYFPDFRLIRDWAIESVGGYENTISGIRLRVEISDLCPFFCDIMGSGEPHTAGILMDNIRLCTLTTASGAEEPELPAMTRLHPVSPNPFNPKTQIRFELSEAGRACLTVYDIAGRRLRTLADKHFGAGTHLESWNGLGDNGRALPSGVYFIRLETRLGAESRKAVLVQ